MAESLKPPCPLTPPWQMALLQPRLVRIPEISRRKLAGCATDASSIVSVDLAWLPERTAVRVKLVARYRYRIFYAVIDETVEVLHIRHTSRRPWLPMR